MNDTPIDLDDGVVEYTPFILLGKRYKFRQFNTDEAVMIQKLGEEGRNKELEDYLEKFIDPVDDAPSFSAIRGKMLIGHWKNLKTMIYTIMGIDESNKDPESPAKDA